MRVSPSVSHTTESQTCVASVIVLRISSQNQNINNHNSNDEYHPQMCFEY